MLHYRENFLASPENLNTGLPVKDDLAYSFIVSLTKKKSFMKLDEVKEMAFHSLCLFNKTFLLQNKLACLLMLR